jgi:hypothetical protein
MDIEKVRKQYEAPPSAASHILRQALLWVVLIAFAGGAIYTASIAWRWMFPPVDPVARAAEIDARDRKFAAQEGVRYYAKDSESVQFREVIVTPKVVCGQYNAKNSYGAYAGFQRFISDGKKSLITEDDLGAERMNALWVLYCQ